MKTRVLDSWAIVEWYLDKQPASGRVRTLLSESETGHARLLISAINVGEVYYLVRKRFSESDAASWRKSTTTLPIKIEVPTLDEIWDAATLKGQYPISYADAFAAALAMKHNCPLVTGDPELKSIDQLQIEWIGS